MYELIKIGATIICFFLAFIIILLIIKSEEKNEKD